jgi:predicted nucleotidyltransferase
MSLSEIKFGLNSATVSAIQAIFAQHPKITQVIIYGSRAKGNYRANSDIDLTMQGAQLDYSLLAKIDNQLDDLLLPYTIDLSIYGKIDNLDLLEHIKRVGQIFYEKLELFSDTSVGHP